MSEQSYALKPLEDAVASHVGGGTPPRQVPSYWKGDVPWASVKDFPESAGVISETEEHISRAGLNASASNLIPAGTPLVCTRMAVGRAALPMMPIAINQDVKAIFPASDVSATYLLKLLQFVQPQAEAQAVGSTVKGIRIQDYLNIPVPLAPPEAQPVIARVLDTLDSAIRETEAIIDKLKAVKQGLLHDLLTRGIDANGELRPPQPEAPQLYKNSPLGWIPKEWDTQQLEELAAEDSPITYGVVQPGPEVEGGVLFVRGGDIFGGRILVEQLRTIGAAVSHSYRRTQLRGGEILMSLVGYPGEVASVPKNLAGANIARQAALIRLRKGVLSAYVMRYLLSANGKRQVLGQSLGSAQQVVNLSDLRHVVIPLPPPHEQLVLSDMAESIQAEIDTETSEHQKLVKLKSGLMDDLLTGRVRVTPLQEEATHG